jgi:PAS domain-containing protein
LSDASPLATFAGDSGGTVMYWNAAAESLLGWQRDEVLGQRLPFANDGLLLNKKGQEVAAAVWKAPIRASNGSSRGMLTIAADSSILRSAGIETAQLPSSIQLAAQN